MERFGHLRRARRVLLTGMSEHGYAVDAVARFAVENDDRAYVALPADSLVVRALRADPDVRFARCEITGRPAGSDQPARADVVSRPRGVRLGWSRHRRTYLRLTPADEPTPWALRLGSG